MSIETTSGMVFGHSRVNPTVAHAIAVRLEPWVSQGEVRVAPILPERFLHLSLSNIIIGRARVSVRTDGSTVDVDCQPTGVRLVTGARTPLTELHRH